MMMMKVDQILDLRLDHCGFRMRSYGGSTISGPQQYRQAWKKISFFLEKVFRL